MKTVIDNLNTLLNDTLNADSSVKDIQGTFKQIADILLKKVCIQRGDTCYMIEDIEFYFYNRNHQDIITHPRKSDGMMWYINSFGGLDLNFKSEARLAEDGKHYELDDNSYFGGILIRQLSINGDKDRFISGPYNCIEAILSNLSAGSTPANAPIIEPSYIDRDFEPLQASRHNMLKKNQSPEDKLKTIGGCYAAGSSRDLVFSLASKYDEDVVQPLYQYRNPNIHKYPK